MAEDDEEQTPDTPILSVDTVDKSFGEVDVLDGISFEVDEGSVTAVAGPNGSGKTTLSRIVAGLDNPTDGRVTVRTAAERPVGYLPQAPRFRPMFTVEETLKNYAKLLSTSPPPDEALTEVGLENVRDRRVDALSGGMRRLLGLAQGFLGSPPILVLDEPTSGLDPRMTRRFFDVSATLADHGTAVLITTHDLTYASETDAVVVLHQGHVATQGTPERILSEAGTDTLTEAFFEIVGTDPTVQSGIREATR
ncbi:ABC transporter ATP-binding protein [Halorarius litoreus]|jgi:ABC-type multidrug transport system ATPase subunit|uniref:ABC transporter ATP-binding protein n=1 Tax=Halorarius litoreus TaxID=2962676 RepID=UPI0020CE31A4|nr:ABC transporter ATP-binding protein [Halorarius litoreus]